MMEFKTSSISTNIYELCTNYNSLITKFGIELVTVLEEREEQTKEEEN